MSKQSTNFPDATGKTTDEEKCGLYESSRTDSGFISGEITEETTSDSVALLDERRTEKPNEKERKVEDVHMFVDSGVCLSENFSKISISQGLNDLNSSKKTQTPVAKAKQPKQEDDIPWKIYYEQDEDGDTHLHMSIAQGFPEVALALIRAAPHPRLLDTPNDSAQTPLHLAVESGQWRVARWLVVAGARPCPRDRQGDSPLHMAARRDDRMCVRALADPVQPREREQLALGYQGHPYRACDFEQWNYLGQTCLHVAAHAGNYEVLKHLLWYGADVNSREGLSGQTALHYAVRNRDERMVRFLMSFKGVEVEAVDYAGKNALEAVGLVAPAVMRALKEVGMITPEISEDEESDDDEPMLDNHLVSPPMVNASA